MLRVEYLQNLGFYEVGTSGPLVSFGLASTLQAISVLMTDNNSLVTSGKFQMALPASPNVSQ